MFSGEVNINNICRCCHSDGCSKSITTEYYHSGHKEIYENMLKETFNINILHYDTDTEISRMICESCILNLRAAFVFKNKVIASETRLANFVEILHNDDKDPQNEIEDALIKSEVCEDEYDGNDLMEVQLNDNSDDDTISIKDEIETLEDFNESCDEMEEQNLEERKNKSKRKKVDRDKNNEKDWIKIAERRGPGPILRENTLKLLLNSTMFAFQWNKSWWACFCCKQSFMEMSALKEHYEEHSIDDIEKKIITQQNRLIKVEISSLNCKKCKIKCDTIPDLREHLTKKHKIKFDIRDDLLIPFKIVTDGFKCQICSETFTVFRLLNIHVNRHYKNHVCHICGASFANLVFLNLHKTRSHRTYNCNTCDINFTSKTDKKNHDRLEHNVVFERKLRFPCPYCEERFSQENLKVQHLVEKHGIVKPEHRCPFCNKVFITKSLCNNHVKNVHKKEKKHECDICHNLFYTKSDVARHRVTHTGEKKFSCSLCTNTFSTRDSLRRHLKRTHDTPN